MATTPKIIASQHEAPHASIAGYVSGFVLSLYLSIFAYVVVVNHIWSSGVLIGAIAGLAFIQFIIQSYFFLHLGTDRKPYWKLWVFGFMILIVLILVVGSVWIMNHLNYTTMTPDQLKNYLHANEGL